MRITGDIKWHPQKQVGTALIELARQAPLSHIKLEQSVAGRQAHTSIPHILLRAQALLWQVSRIPSAYNEAARVGLTLNLLHHLADLINGATIRTGPATPLLAVNRSQIPLRIGPLIPDAAPALLQPLHIGAPLSQPQQYDDNALQVAGFRGHQRKTLD